MRRFASFLSLVVFLAFCSCGEKEKGSQAFITTGSLVEEMVDLVKLASFPESGDLSRDLMEKTLSSPDIFFFPYCGQPRNDGPGNRGFVTNFRWHVLDPLPFQENIRFFIELFSHERTPGLSYARIGYHYGRPGLTDGESPSSSTVLR